MTAEQRIAALEAEIDMLRAELAEREAVLKHMWAEGNGLLLAFSSVTEDMLTLVEKVGSPGFETAA